MANHAFIFQAEDKIIAAKELILEIKKVMELEKAINNGSLYKENYNVWGTLLVNVHSLKKACESLEH